MNKTIIWVRHGVVNTPQKQYDQLLPEREESSRRLPALLRQHSINLNAIYFDESTSDGSTPERCRVTVSWLDESLKKSFTCANVFEAKQFLLDLNPEDQVIVICYKTESFFDFLRLGTPNLQNIWVEKASQTSA